MTNWTLNVYYNTSYYKVLNIVFFVLCFNIGVFFCLLKKHILELEKSKPFLPFGTVLLIDK